MKALCEECGEALEHETEETRPYVGSGLDENVVLVNLKIWTCKNGHEEIGIRDIFGLNREIAMRLAQKEARLMPGEIRFLRTHLGLSSGDLARRMGVTVETVSRWEKKTGPALAMKLSNERFLRLMVLNEKPVDHYPLEKLDDLGVLEATPLKLKLKASRHGWKEVRA